MCITYHGQVDMFHILESVEQLDEPGGLDGSQDISFDEHMLDFVHFCKCTLSHFLQGAHFPGINLSSEIDGSVASLTDLCDDSELLDAELRSSLSEQDSFSTIVRLDFTSIFGTGDLVISL
jgi:hypothetical protein